MPWRWLVARLEVTGEAWISGPSADIRLPMEREPEPVPVLGVEYPAMRRKVCQEQRTVGREVELNNAEV